MRAESTRHDLIDSKNGYWNFTNDALNDWRKETWVDQFSDESNKANEKNRNKAVEDLRASTKLELTGGMTKTSSTNYRWRQSGFSQCSASCLGGNPLPRIPGTVSKLLPHPIECREECRGVFEHHSKESISGFQTITCLEKKSVDIVSPQQAVKKYIEVCCLTAAQSIYHSIFYALSQGRSWAQSISIQQEKRLGNSIQVVRAIIPNL